MEIPILYLICLMDLRNYGNYGDYGKFGKFGLMSFRDGMGMEMDGMSVCVYAVYDDDKGGECFELG